MTETTNDQLKPCPFCGAPADDFNPDGEMEGYSIRCSGRMAIFNADESCCPMHTFSYKNEQDARDAWNRRASPASAAPLEPMVRFCPACGSIGDIYYSKHRDCCPDGSEARRIPVSLANKCRELFMATLANVAPIDPSNELIDAVANLIKVKGRFHTEQAYQRVADAYDRLMRKSQVE
jgi:hypothetical protein